MKISMGKVHRTVKNCVETIVLDGNILNLYNEKKLFEEHMDLNDLEPPTEWIKAHMQSIERENTNKELIQIMKIIKKYIE